MTGTLFGRARGHWRAQLRFDAPTQVELRRIACKVSHFVLRAVFLFNPKTAPFAKYYLDPFKAAAVSLGVEPVAASVESTSDLQTVFAAQAEIPDTGLIMMPDGFLNVHRTPRADASSKFSTSRRVVTSKPK
jgi:hypothetical protein